MGEQASLDSLVIDIEAIDRSAIMSLEKLSDALRTIKQDVNGAAGANFDALGNGFGRLVDAISSIDDSKLQKIKDFASTLHDLSSKMDFSGVTKGLDGIKLDPKTVDALSKLSEQAKEALQPFENLHSVLVDVDKELKLKPKDMKGVNAALKEMERKTQKSTSAFGKLTSMFKRIMMLRAVRAIISEITQGIREGLDNAYAFSSAINGDLANSLDNISSASLKMKNQAGSAFGELLRATEPAIIKISQLVTDLADMISRLIAMFNGSSTYLQAQDVETTWNDGTKAVKEYKKQLLGLDELNVLNNQKSNSGSAIPNTKKMFKEVAVDSGIDKGTFAEMQRAVSVVKEAVSNIVDMIKSPEFKKLASLVGTILKESFILAIGTIGDVAKLVKSVLSGDWEASLDTILGWGEKASNFIDNLGGKIFGEKWEEYKTSLGNFVGDLQEKIGKVFDPETWKSTFKSITDSLSQALLNVFNNEFAVDLFDFFGIDIRPWLQTLKPAVKLPEGSELVTNTATANKNTGVGAWNKYGVYEGNYKKDDVSQQSSEWYENRYGNKTNDVYDSSGQKITIDINHDGIIDWYDAKMIDEYRRVGARYY